MAPWSWLIGQATRLHGRASLGDRRTQFLLAWSIGTLVLFELVRTKLVHYYLPAYPAIALFIASGFLLRRDRFPTLASRVNPMAGWLSVGIGSLLLLAAGAVAVLATKGGDGPLMLAVGMIVLVLGLGLLASGWLGGDDDCSTHCCRLELPGQPRCYLFRHRFCRSWARHASFIMS